MSLWIKSHGVTIQMKATVQYFTVVLFIMLYKGGYNNVLSFGSVDEILWCILQYFTVQQAQQK